MDLPELFKNYAAGVITFEDLTAAASDLKWATRFQEGENVWWSNRNTSSVVDLAFIENVIDEKQRDIIFDVISSTYK